jgi:hypothetical protein
MIERRTFLATIAGGILAGPVAAEAQQADRVRQLGLLLLERDVRSWRGRTR